MLRILLLICCANLIFAQQQQTDLDLLNSPYSPAAGLLGVSSNDVHRISDFTALSALLTQSSEGFSALPSNFAIEVHPFAVANNRSLSDELDSSLDKKRIAQSLAISFAASDKNTNFLATGFGLRITLVNGKIDSLSRANISEFIGVNQRFDQSYQDNFLATISTPEYTSLEQSLNLLKVKRDQLNMRRFSDSISEQDRLGIESEINNVELQENEIKLALDGHKRELLAEFNENNKDTLAYLDRQLDQTNIVRTGFKLELSAGMRQEYPDSTFSSIETSRAALWLTANYDVKNVLDIAAIARLQHNPSLQYRDLQSVLQQDNTNFFDSGIRIGYSPKKFQASWEGIYRNVLNNDDVDESVKWILNASYDVGKNTSLEFSYGQDFDNTELQSGNVIAALEFVKGFGSSRKAE